MRKRNIQVLEDAILSELPGLTSFFKISRDADGTCTAKFIQDTWLVGTNEEGRVSCSILYHAATYNVTIVRSSKDINPRGRVECNSQATNLAVAFHNARTEYWKYTSRLTDVPKWDTKYSTPEWLR